MLSDTTSPELREQAISELECLALNTYTPISRKEWERSQAIAESVLDEVFGA
ncbi:hypothetical protein [Spirosoma rhododendri]|uniref:Uncharacterized protein n=1 Tax=Spirosoma rhododendri TaxID=2728024 RepID=A0A7L5DPV3_9BACT|nr:hypothetical protein [Spirosoma rhododendri]QJD79612.1 hypothetical protein HH216_15190 [Spirosoma rhododendri]